MENNLPEKNKGIMRLIKACHYSYCGFVNAFKNEAAFRQELYICAPLTVLALCLNFSGIVKLILILSMLGLLIVELLNSAIEECVNLASPQIHPLAKRSKDMASAAVTLAIVSVSIAWAYALYTLFA